MLIVDDIAESAQLGVIGYCLNCIIAPGAVYFFSVRDRGQRSEVYQLPVLVESHVRRDGADLARPRVPVVFQEHIGVLGSLGLLFAAEYPAASGKVLSLRAQGFDDLAVRAQAMHPGAGVRPLVCRSEQDVTDAFFRIFTCATGDWVMV